jgi:putative sporulation protein YtaF
MLKILLLVTAVSADSFAASIGFGSAKIKIPFKSALVISIIGTVSLSLSVLFADVIGLFLSAAACRWVSFCLLMLLGIYNLSHDSIKNEIKKHKKDKSFAVNLYLDETAADKDNSKSLSAGEAVALAVALSADSIVTGVSAGLTKVNIFVLSLTSLIFGIMSIILGCLIGQRLSLKKTMDFGFMCGGILIVLAFLQLCC